MTMEATFSSGVLRVQSVLYRVMFVNSDGALYGVQLKTFEGDATSYKEWRREVETTA